MTPPTLAPRSEGTPIASIESREHHDFLQRIRTGTGAGVLCWMAFFVADVLVDQLIVPGVLVPLLLIRGFVLMIIGPAHLSLNRNRTPSPNHVQLVGLTTFLSGACGVAAMCVFAGGIQSPYYVGIVLCFLARGAFMSEPWRAGVRTLAAMGAAFPLAMGVGAIFDPAIRAQFSEPVALGNFILACAFLLSLALFVMLGSHSTWALRQQVFESRGVGRYRLKHKIGQGGMGEVWSASHPGMKRQVAVKLLRADGRAGRRANERFDREVEATSQLSHPNTIRVFDYGSTEDGILYYAMELLGGQDLASLVETEGPLPEGRATHILLQAARAMEEAHSHGIVHRDIKPENVFLTTDGNVADFVKLLDFGIAKITTGDEADRMTRTGAVLGTPHFISPEGAMGGETDARSDIYALGAVLHFMLTGKVLYEESSAEAILFAHATKPLPSFEKLGISPPVARILERALAKVPSSRFENGGEFAAALAATGLAAEWTPATAQLATPGDPDVSLEPGRDASGIRAANPDAETICASDSDTVAADANSSHQ